MSSSSSEDNMHDPVELHDQYSEDEFHARSSHEKHASWADHKFTSDGDVLTLDSPRATGDRGKAEEDGHVRSLSGQLFGMNLSGSFSPNNSITYSPDPEGLEPSDEFEHEGLPEHSLKVPSDLEPSYPTQQARESVGRKHRRGLSHGKSNPSMAHRRVDSGGNTAFVNRQGPLIDGSFDRRPHHKGYHQYPPSHRDHHNPSPPEHRGYQGHHGHWHHQRRPSPHYDRDPGYAPPHGPPPPQHYRTSPHPSPPPPHYAHPREDGRHYAREDPYYHRGLPRSAPPRYHDHRSGYPPNPPGGPGHNIHRNHSPHPSAYSGSMGSTSSRSDGSRTHTPDSYQHRYQREEPAPYYAGQRADEHHPQHAPPPQHPYPVQHQHNDRHIRRSPISYAPPLHPLADNLSPTLPPAPVPDSYQRQTSQCSLGTGSEGRIETEEILFAAGSQALPSHGNPRISPQLFDAVLNGSPPPESLPPHDNRFAQENSADVQLPPPENRVRTASNDSFIRLIETSQVHKRGASIDSLVIDEALFGENILRERERSDSLAPISVIVAKADDSSTIHSVFMDPISHNRFNVYPDHTQSQSVPPPYEVGSQAAPLNAESIAAESGTVIPLDTKPASASLPLTEAPVDCDYEPAGRHITGKVSKRARRKCSIHACDNRVVQGGLCISHGAKRKTCGHLGCTKNVKKAGMCSAHGPPRKLCEYQNCSKVAVQGGKCIAHGAKKKLCFFDTCKKQAILGGMCKKHHDIQAEEEVQLCQPIQQNGGNSRTVDGDQGGRPAHARGLSIFTDNDIQEKIITQEINLSGE